MSPTRLQFLKAQHRKCFEAIPPAAYQLPLDLRTFLFGYDAEKVPECLREFLDVSTRFIEQVLVVEDHVRACCRGGGGSGSGGSDGSGNGDDDDDDGGGGGGGSGGGDRGGDGDRAGGCRGGGGGGATGGDTKNRFLDAVATVIQPLRRMEGLLESLESLRPAELRGNMDQIQEWREDLDEMQKKLSQILVNTARCLERSTLEKAIEAARGMQSLRLLRCAFEKPTDRRNSDSSSSSSSSSNRSSSSSSSKDTTEESTTTTATVTAITTTRTAMPATETATGGPCIERGAAIRPSL